MANFQEHFDQAIKNLDTLSQVNDKIPNSWDWQVTIAFYAAVHIANAHIAKTINQHYRSHSDVKNAINYYTELSPSKFSEEAYISYVRLLNYSRRSRYLCSDKQDNHSTEAHHISEKHFAKSMRLLDSVLKYFDDKYNPGIGKRSIMCQNIQADELRYFEKITLSAT